MIFLFHQNKPKLQQKIIWKHFFSNTFLKKKSYKVQKNPNGEVAWSQELLFAESNEKIEDPSVTLKIFEKKVALCQKPQKKTLCLPSILIWSSLYLRKHTAIVVQRETQNHLPLLPRTGNLVWKLLITSRPIESTFQLSFFQLKFLLYFKLN